MNLLAFQVAALRLGRLESGGSLGPIFLANKKTLVGSNQTCVV